MATINVTQEHIDEGRPTEMGCPVARAIRAATGECVRVTLTYVYVLDRPIGPLPAFVSNIINDYGKAGHMSPFSFELEVPNG